MGAYGAVLAQLHFERTGCGQLVDVAMLDTAFMYVAGMGVMAEKTLLNRTRPQIGNNSFYNYTDAFEAKDGWLVISAIGNGIWERLANVVGSPELLDRSKFGDDNSRYENRNLIRPVIAAWVARQRVCDVVEILENNRVPCGKVNAIGDMVEDPQLLAREMIVNRHHGITGTAPVPGVVVKLSETPGGIEADAPALGEHNKEIYGDLLGYVTADLEVMHREGVI